MLNLRLWDGFVTVLSIRSGVLSARYVPCLSVTLETHIVFDAGNPRKPLPTPEAQVMRRELPAADEGVPGLDRQRSTLDLAQTVLALSAEQTLPQEQHRVLLRQPLARGQVLEELGGQLLVVLTENVAQRNRQRAGMPFTLLANVDVLNLRRPGWLSRVCLISSFDGYSLLLHSEPSSKRPDDPEGRRHDFRVVLA